MKNKADAVQKLLDRLPRDRDENSIHAFNGILSEYRNLLDGLYDTNEEYVRLLWSHDSALRTIESSMATRYQIKDKKKKDATFNEALKRITNDLEDLLQLLRR